MPKKAEFLWTDDETELLLSVTHEYKVFMRAQLLWVMCPQSFTSVYAVYTNAFNPGIHFCKRFQIYAFPVCVFV